ncbi:hypothetical protein Rhe02_54180 [Rhizocola hellebori]|uniref:Uncharacterized protein n=1 Tax=Rhizocola hellebori TaxID=1392758 RepID=A0A8J3QB78_9ACTN|nr:hypothetical protein [Rhizocola hellebori]GIH07351.1 hypothetical protein Rhe02_54180 [Rhizocola hellebori]
MKPGAEAYVDGLCGCQYLLRPLRVRVISVMGEASIGPHLLWVQVYQLASWGDAVDTRELLVIRTAFEAACVRGLRNVSRPPKPNSARRPIPRPRNEVSYASAR